MPRDCSPYTPNQCSTAYSISTEVYLRVVSRGTCYCPSRLDFHPYTQRVRAICTSATVRSSTQLSSGFNLARHRSTGFRFSTIDFRRAHLVPHPEGLRTCRFPYGFGDQLLNLANDQDSQGHFSKRTSERCSYHRFHAHSACS